MKLNILLSTINEGIYKASTNILEPRDDVQYIISHQFTEESYKSVPTELLEREDVRISQIPGQGVATSRNNAMSIADAGIALFADDDATNRHEYFTTVLNTFRDNPDLDVALFKIKTGPGEPEYKDYPRRRVKLTKKLFSVSTLEVAYRVDSLKSKPIYFDERFGAGKKLLIGGEETIFIEDCIKAGFHVEFFPEYVSEHTYNSTIKCIQAYDKKKIWVEGAYDFRTNGSIALLKAFSGTMKNFTNLKRNGVSPFYYLFHRISAALYILFTNRKFRK